MLDKKEEKVRVLMVDDEEDICEALSHILIRENYEVRVAYNKKEALDKLHTFLPQVVLLDISLGGDDGFEVLTEAKKMDRSIVVIMVTGLEDDRDILKAKELGADEYIRKPLKGDYLKRVISEKISLLSLKKDSFEEKE